MAPKPRSILAIGVVIACTATTAVAQEHAARRSGDSLIPSCQFDRALCGYADRNGTTIVPPQFDWADRFFDGRARVRSRGLYGFIDEAGEPVVPPIYDTVSPFWNGFAQVRKDGRTALIDTAGRILVPADYELIIPLDREHALVSPAKELPNRPGAATPNEFQLQPSTLSLIKAARYRQTHKTPDFRGTAIIGSKRWSLLNMRTGEKTDPVRAGVLFLTDKLGSPYWWIVDGKYYLKDASGTRLTDAFDRGSLLYRDRAIVSRNGRMGAIDSEGTVVIPLVFDHIIAFSHDDWSVFRKGPRGGGKYGFVDRNGNVVIEARFDYVLPFKNGRTKVRVGPKEFQIDRSGSTIAGTGGCQDGLTRRFGDKGQYIAGADGQPINDQTYIYVGLNCGEPTLVCKPRQRCGYVDRDGALIAGRYFRSAKPFFDGVAVIKPSEDQIAIIDREGRFILQPMHPKVEIFTTGSQRTGFVSSQGRVLIDRKVAEALARAPSPLLWSPKTRPRCREDGVSIVENGQSIAFLDQAGRPFIRGRYDYATCFRQGAAWVAIPDRREWCQITKSGQILRETCRCHQPLISQARFATRKRNGKRASCYDFGLKRVRDHYSRRPMRR